MVVGDGMTAGAVEARRFYVDVHRLAGRGRRNKPDESFHVFTADGVGFGKAERISEIPAEAGDTMFCDVIPVELTDEFVDVLRRGVRVFYLRRLTLLKPTYEKLELKSKTAKNDIRALMAIEPKWFREVNEDFLIMRRLIAAYRTLLKSRLTLVNRVKALNGSERSVLLPALETLDRQRDAMAALVVEEACKRIPSYSRVAESLGIAGDNHLTAGEALAELMTYVDFGEGIRDVKNYVGLFKGRPKIYSGPSRRALERLTIAIKGYNITAKDMLTTLKQIREEIRREAQKRLEVMPA